MRALVLAAMLASAPAAAQVAVKDAWVRATVPSQTATGAFMEITSSRAATLVGVESPIAGIIEVHESKLVGNVMQMREVPRLPLPAGQPVALKPGGYHVMLIDLARPLKAGESVPLRLRIESADRSIETVEVSARVRPLAGK